MATVACNVTSNIRLTDAIVPAHRGTRPALVSLAIALIGSAFHDACKSRDRMVAAHSLRWLRRRTDWTRLPLDARMKTWGKPAPDVDARNGHALSFEWACQVADLNPDTVRRNGLQWHQHQPWHVRGGLSEWRTWRQTRPRPAARRRYEPMKRPEIAVVHPTPALRTLTQARGYPSFVAYCSLVDVLPLTQVQWNILAG
jgi:hypothetical protein